MSMIIDGTNGLTFNNATTQASAGVVLQVVQGTSTASATTTSTSFVTTGFSASITPKFSTSKIAVFVTGQLYPTAGGTQGFATIYRGATNLGDSTQGFGPNAYAASTAITVGSSFNYLDSPATTSSTTYTIYYRCNTGSVYFNGASGTVTIILMEIAG
jgi:hypothetical protein